MKKYAIGVLTLALTLALFTGCGCTNSKPMNTQPSTLPPTTGATLMPTTEAATMPTTMATTMATESEIITGTEDTETASSTVTEAPVSPTDTDGARSKMPANSKK